MKNVNKSLQPLLSVFSDMVCSIEEIHSVLKSSKLLLIISEVGKTESDKYIHEWMFQILQSMKIFNDMKDEINRLIDSKRK